MHARFARAAAACQSGALIADKGIACARIKIDDGPEEEGLARPDCPIKARHYCLLGAQ